MDFAEATERVLLGESLQQLAAAYRDELCRDLGLDPEDAAPETFHADTRRFMNKLCRHLGDRHGGDTRIGVALQDWVQLVDDYDAYDALLSGFRFEGRTTVLERGRRLFPGTLTAHWDG